MRNLTFSQWARVLSSAFLAVILGRPALADLDDAVGAYRAGHYETAVVELRRLAEAGDAEAQRWLGLAYRAGQGVPQSAADAMFWLRAAADRGDGEAQIAYGDMHYFGAGVPQDMAEAARWYRAAATGSARAPASRPPTLYLAFSSDAHTAVELADVAGRIAGEKLQGVAGIADMTVVGVPLAVIRIVFDTARLAAYGITLQAAQQALQLQGVALSAGGSVADAAVLTMLWESGQRLPEDFAALVLTQAGGVPVRLSDVAMIELGIEAAPVTASYDGRKVVALAIATQATASPLAVAAAVCRALPQIEMAMPADIGVDIADESTMSIEREP